MQLPQTALEWLRNVLGLLVTPVGAFTKCQMALGWLQYVLVPSVTPVGPFT